MKQARVLVGMMLVGLVALGGCRSGGSGSSETEKEGSARPEETTASGLRPCQLLGPDAVATVLPEHDEGFVAKQGGSLIEGVDAYQCSYSNPSGSLLTVILNVAVDEDRFGEIKPSGFAMGGDARKLDVADGGWLRGRESSMKATVLKGHTVIDLELLAPDAGKRKDALVELARQVASKAP